MSAIRERDLIKGLQGRGVHPQDRTSVHPWNSRVSLRRNDHPGFCFMNSADKHPLKSSKNHPVFQMANVSPSREAPVNSCAELSSRSPLSSATRSPTCLMVSLQLPRGKTAGTFYWTETQLCSWPETAASRRLPGGTWDVRNRKTPARNRSEHVHHQTCHQS